MPETNIRVLAPQPDLYYYDRQDTYLAREVSALAVWNAFIEEPQPLLQVAFWIRDKVSFLFGVKQISGFSGRGAETVKPGQYLDFFLVEHIEDDCVVLTERDRHLDVMTCISIQNETLSITSSVCVHNLFGRAYMVPVGIAHRWIVRRMLRRLHKTLGPETKPS